MSYDQSLGDAVRLLAEARKAWRDKRAADSELARLARYRRLSPGMKDDRQRWSALRTEAEDTLARVLATPSWVAVPVRESASPPALPLYPTTDVPDEREPGVLLLDFDDESKTTADRISPDRWRIVDWEVQSFDGVDHWFARWWFTVSDAHVSRLAGAP